ncbi:uncharacterized protein BKCO1_750003 [Diplodia corticola]|uniref:Uncharacterized protein n=1 Tax=Diplodia corticola TaxID=236234 RepID=A0A1J9RB55_9PEZI|nr:uncharacterized protein BKCO1_750003 [Diplodia corticola]OJD29659.1 hypothetical protein BKCO1_750003 [Diplodia corticola]
MELTFESYDPSTPEPSVLPGQDVFLPGFGLPLDELPPWSREDNKQRFPHAILELGASNGITLRERRMLDFVNKISDKPEWDRKVFDESIVSKWQMEATRYDDEIKDVYLSKQMFDHCILELREKALVHQDKGLVAVLDVEVAVMKSDVAVPETLRQALIEHVRPLEDVPKPLKDWHPGSNKMVLDLVHPSLYPVVFGRTRALPSGRVPLNDCAKYIGKGEVIPAHDTDDFEIIDEWTDESWDLPAWGNFQWLPAQIDFTPDGHAKIASYINNLHPQDHAHLYTTLEQFVDKAVPLWNESLSWFHDRTRIHPGELNDDNWEVPIFPQRTNHPDSQLPGDEDWSPRQDRIWACDHSLEAEYDRWWKANRVLKPIEPSAFAPFASTLNRPGAHPIDLKRDFATDGLQVIFKLATIHLTPSQPSYSGSTWHVEGSLNERICATALYYLDAHNTTPSSLAFRQGINIEEMAMKPAQYEHSSLHAYYGIPTSPSAAAVQPLGRVATPPARLLAFPNTLQHRVDAFQLADPTRPGWRKILAMFLVDPRQRVLSSANVPPQRRDWWVREVRESVARLRDLPEAVWREVVGYLGEGEEWNAGWGWEEAVKVREEVMAERGRLGKELEGVVKERVFNFCEH